MPKVREDEIFAQVFEPHSSLSDSLNALLEKVQEKIKFPTWRVFDDVELYIVEDKGEQYER